MKRLLLNSLSGGVYFFVQAVVTFFLTPVTVLCLGNRDYGSWEILLSVYMYVNLLDLGINPAIVRYVARAAARDDRDGICSVFNSSLLLTGAGGVLGFILLSVLGTYPERFLNLEQSSTLRLSFWIMGFNLLIRFPGVVLVDVLMGMQRHYLVHAIRTSLMVLHSAAIYWALTTQEEDKLVWLAGILTLSAAVQFAVMAIAGYHFGLRLRTRGLSRSGIKELYSFGLKSMGLMAAARIQRQSVPIIIGWLMGATNVVFFAIPSRLVNYASDLVIHLGIPFTAHFSSLDACGDRDAMRDAWMRSSRFLQLVIFGVGIAIVALGEAFLGVWLGSQYADGGRWVIRMLGVAFLFEGLAPNSGRLLVATARHGRPAAIALAISVLAIPLTILLGHSFGINGIAISAFASRTAYAVILLSLAQKFLGVSLTHHLRATVARFLIPVLLYVAVLLLARRIAEPDSYPSIPAHVSVAVAIYLAASWRFALDRNERGSVRAAVSKLTRRFSGR